MNTNEALRLYLKLGYMVRLYGAYLYNSLFIPLIPNIFMRGSDLISLQGAIRIYDTVMTEYKIAKKDTTSEQIIK